jgi:hypothetical protein
VPSAGRCTCDLDKFSGATILPIDLLSTISTEVPDGPHGFVPTSILGPCSWLDCKPRGHALVTREIHAQICTNQNRGNLPPPGIIQTKTCHLPKIGFLSQNRDWHGSPWLPPPLLSRRAFRIRLRSPVSRALPSGRRIRTRHRAAAGVWPLRRGGRCWPRPCCR